MTRPLARTARLARAGVRATVGLAVRGAGSAAEDLVETLGDLRGLAAKVGQMASYVEGIVPADPVAAAAFARLRTETTLTPSSEIRAIVEEDLGPDAFSTWVDTPLASASLGQVHRATLHDGTDVAVKVLHPGIREAVAADLGQAENIGRVAGLLARGIPVDALLEEVRARLTDELDLATEARHQAAFAAAFDGDPAITVPTVWPDRSSGRILTSRFAEGWSLEEAAAAPVALRSAWSVAVFRLFVDGALRTGLLHGDPHPGNLMFRPDGGIVGLDFGCVQPLDDDAMAHLRALLAAGLDRPDAIPDRIGRIQGHGRLAEAMAPAWQAILAPLGRVPYTVDRPLALRIAAAVRASKDPRIALRSDPGRVPPWFLLSHRTFIGLVSVLSRLNAPADYATPTRAALAAQR